MTRFIFALVVGICIHVLAGWHVRVHSSSFPEDEYFALYDLYNSTGGKDWAWRNTSLNGALWTFGGVSNPCTDHWQGINCTLDISSGALHVQALQLFGYNLTGSIPGSIVDLTELAILNLGGNVLRGEIPSNLNKLTDLKTLDLQLNNLKGYIPPGLADLVELIHLDLSNNTLIGTIPVEIWNLPNLQYLSLHHNHLFGHFPSFMGNAIKLQYVSLNTNRLSGQLPASLGNLLQLQLFNVRRNFLSGPIPDTIGNLADLQFLELSLNYFSGCIPDSIGNLSSLQWLQMYHNELHCHVPSSFAKLSPTLMKLSIGENHLSGLVPSIFHDFPLLQDLSLGTNLLSGAPATFLGQLPALLFLYLDNNLFTGTIPTVITDNNHLQDLVIYGNHLTGTIAASVGEMVNITDLDLSLNYLTGSIPKLTKLIHIEGCLLRFNKLSGNVNGLFDPFTQTQLNTLQINNNQLTGIIPPEFFALRRLNTLVATNNCFQGTLPDNICDAASLLSLILDGMSSAAACRRELFPGMLQSYVTTLSVKGTVPACLFQLPNLTTLHLSGNGFYGTLPDIDFFGAALVDVALSYNALTGTIPKALQERKWYSLDLSFNLLRGTLSEDIHTKPIYNLPHFNYTFKFLKPSFSLENNFLSGKIPTQLHDLPSISILGTNLFDCDLLGSQLPQSDNDRSTYQCGSTAFDTPYYVFIGLCVVVFVVTAAVTGQQRQRLCTSVVQNVEVIMHHIAQCSDKLGRLDNLCKVAAWCTAYAVLLLLPVYVVFQPYYGVMRYQYAWSVSAAFLSSSTAADALMFLWLFLLGFFLYFVERYGVSKSRTIERSAAIRLEELTRIGYTSYQENKVFAMYTTVNVVVVLSANVLYVYVTIYESSSVLFLVRILMSIFKLFWNNICAPRLLFYICEWILPDSGSQADKLVTLQLTIALVNTIVIPCLVVAGISSDCFYNLFVAAPAVASNYASQVCQVGNVEDQCLEYLQYPGTTTFDPPFTYKYQCSWSLVIYYAPPFVYMCIVSIFVVPAALLVAVRLRAYATKGTYLYSVIDSCIPTIMQSFSGDDASQHVTKRTSFCRGPRAVMMLLTLTGLVLTFGVVFPPLAAAFMATMIAATLFDKYKVGKFRAAALELGLTQLLQVLDQDCLDLDIVPVHESAIWMLVTLSCWFYSLFLFDILGSVVGFQRAFWVLIVFPLLPLCFYVARSALYYLFNKFGTAAEQNVFDNGTIELELGEKKTSTIIQLETENVLHSTQ